MSQWTRRRFLQTAAATAVGMTFGCRTTAAKRGNIRGANEDIRMSVIGIRGQGGGHINEWRNLPGVRLVAICDVDSQVLARRARELENNNIQVRQYTDVRRLLEDPEIDAVSIATPNHWHALATIWACQAGKDVYCEKPLTHNVWEGRKVMDAAEKYGRIVQCGMQRRSDEGWMEAIEWVNQGNIGRVLYSRGLCYKRRESIGKVSGPQTPPASVDYDLWCGPREVTPLMRRELHYDWHWVWPTGNGDIGNQGVHQVDVAAWAINEQTLPTSVFSVGGRFGYDDDGETPNTQFIFLDYKPVPIIFEVCGLPLRPGVDTMPVYKNGRIANVIECEGGYLTEGWAYDNDGRRIRQFPVRSGGPIYANFIQAVRSRRSEDLVAPPLIGHIAAACCHLGNISHRVGEEASPEEIADALSGNDVMLETFERFSEHLAVNGVDLRTDKAVLGPQLQFDPRREQFVGSGPVVRRANELLTEDYRREFRIPNRV